MKVFISYRHDDAWAVAQQLRHQLEEAFGPGSVYLDVAARMLGDIRQHMAAHIAASDAVVVVIGHDWVGPKEDGSRRIDSASDPVRYEVETALADERLAVVPVLVDGARIPQEDQLPKSLRNLPWRGGFPVRANSIELDAVQLLDVLRTADPDAPAALKQHAAVVLGGSIRWLVPEPSVTLHAGELDGREPLVGASVALSADGSLLAQIIGRRLAVYSLSDPGKGAYERWRTITLEGSWREPKVLAVRRRGTVAAEVALTYGSEHTGAKKVVRVELSASAAHWLEADGSAVVGAFHGSSLLYVVPAAEHLWAWRREERAPRPWAAELGVRPGWLDAAITDGDLLLAVLGRSASSSSDAWVVLVTDPHEGPEAQLGVQRRSNQVVVPRSLDRGGRRRIVVKTGEWIEVGT